MKRQMIPALLKLETVALSIPFIFTVVIFVALELLLSGFGNGDPQPYPWIFWMLLGLVFGAGLVARERRLSTDRILGTLPVPAWKFHGLRFAFRSVFLPILVLILICFKPLLDRLFYHRTLPGADSQIVLAVIAALVGLSYAAAVSSVVRRESIALGGGFMGIMGTGVLFIGIILLHPENHLIFSTSFKLLPWLGCILFPAGAISVIQAVETRDAGSSREINRMIIPLLAAVGISSVILWIAPYYLLAQPLEKRTKLSYIKAIPGSDAVLLASRNSPGLFRVTDTDSIRLTGNLIRFNPSSTGRFINVLRQRRFLWQHGSQLQLLDIDGEKVRPPVTGYISYQHGAWSPDDRYFATVKLADNQLIKKPATKADKITRKRTRVILFLPSDPEKPPWEWRPVPADAWATGALIVVGWKDSGHLICVSAPKLKQSSCGPVEIWEISPESRSGSKVWTGDLCLPPFFEWQRAPVSMFINRERNSIFLICREPSESDSQGRLLEIFPDGGELVIHAEHLDLSDTWIDHTDSHICWITTGGKSRGSRYSDLIVHDINSMSSKSFRLPGITSALLSPNGKFAACHGYDKTHPEYNGVTMVNLATGETRVSLESVDEMIWTDRNRLAVLSHKGTEFGYLDPETNRYTKRLELIGRGGDK